MKKLLLSLVCIMFIFILAGCNKVYTISYYSDNVLFQIQEVKSGDEINLIDAPIRNYYTFVEWRLKDGTKFDIKTMPKENVELYAYYEESEFLEKIVIKLTDGRKIYVDLYSDVAPISVENFLKLVDMKYYDGVVFHRIIKDFMIQTGGYYVEDHKLLEKPKLEPIVGEFIENGINNTLKHTAGVISMARTSEVNSATSQFFICSVDCPHLDGKYAAFGKVSDEESLRVVLEISNVRTISLSQMFANFPTEPVIIDTIERL